MITKKCNKKMDLPNFKKKKKKKKLQYHVAVQRTL